MLIQRDFSPKKDITSLSFLPPFISLNLNIDLCLRLWWDGSFVEFWNSFPLDGVTDGIIDLHGLHLVLCGQVGDVHDLLHLGEHVAVLQSHVLHGPLAAQLTHVSEWLLTLYQLAKLFEIITRSNSLRDPGSTIGIMNLFHVY